MHVLERSVLLALPFLAARTRWHTASFACAEPMHSCTSQTSRSTGCARRSAPERRALAPRAAAVLANRQLFDIDSRSCMVRLILAAMADVPQSGR